MGGALAKPFSANATRSRRKKVQNHRGKGYEINEHHICKDRGMDKRHETSGELVRQLHAKQRRLHR